jgi:hypothetical protein
LAAYSEAELLWLAELENLRAQSLTAQLKYHANPPPPPVDPVVEVVATTKGRRVGGTRASAASPQPRPLSSGSTTSAESKTPRTTNVTTTKVGEHKSPTSSNTTTSTGGVGTTTTTGKVESKKGVASRGKKGVVEEVIVAVAPFNKTDVEHQQLARLARYASLSTRSHAWIQVQNAARHQWNAIQIARLTPSEMAKRSLQPPAAPVVVVAPVDPVPTASPLSSSTTSSKVARAAAAAAAASLAAAATAVPVVPTMTPIAAVSMVANSLLDMITSLSSTPVHIFSSICNRIHRVLCIHYSLHLWYVV